MKRATLFAIAAIMVHSNPGNTALRAIRAIAAVRFERNLSLRTTTRSSLPLNLVVNTLQTGFGVPQRSALHT